MANQQPPAGRPWFRLASVARMEAAAAAGAARNPPRPTTPPVPRLPVPRTQQQSLQSLPPPQMQPPPPPPQVRSPTPPPRQPEPRPALLLITPRLQPEIQTPLSLAPPPPTEPPQPPLPPLTATAPESPKVIRPTYSIPPDLPNAMLPQPAQAQPIELTPNPDPEPEPEPEPKLLLPLQPKTITSPEVGNDKLSSAFYNKTQGSTTEKSNETASAGKFREEGIKRTITIAGENTGAIMELGSAAHRRRAHDHGGIKEQKEGNKGGHMVEHEHGDEKSKEIHKEKEKEKAMAAVVNSNVQSINNSIVLNSSCTLQSPGVHITFDNHRQSKSRAGTSKHEAHFPHIN